MLIEREWRYEPTYTPIASYDGMDVTTMDIGYGRNEIRLFPVGDDMNNFSVKEGDPKLTNTDRKIEHPIWNLYEKRWVKTLKRKQKNKPEDL